MCFCGARALSDSMRIQKLLKLLVRHLLEVRLSRLESRLRQIFAHVANFRERLPLLVGHPCAVPAVADALLHAVRLPVAGNRDSRLIAEPHADKVRLRQIVHPVDLLVLRPAFYLNIPKVRHIDDTQHHQQIGYRHNVLADSLGVIPQRYQDDADDEQNHQQHHPNRPLRYSLPNFLNFLYGDVFWHVPCVFSLHYILLLSRNC